MEELVRFLNSINFDYEDELSNTVIDKVILKKDTNTYNVYLRSENVFKGYLCHILNNTIYKQCFNTIFNNLNFFFEFKENTSNISALIYLNRNNIENLLLLMATIPFLRNNSNITFIIKNYKTFKNLKKAFKNKFFTKKSFNINESAFHQIKHKLINLLNYKWEIIPNKNIINIIRYTINNYYDETFLDLFDRFLNLNYKYYLESNVLSFENQISLMSKFLKQI